MDELPSPEDQLRQRVVVKRSQDGFQPVGVEPVGWSELREGDRVLGMEELLYIFPPHSSSDTSEELASDEDMADMAFHVLECEKVPILDDLIAASTPPDSMEDSKHAGTDGSLKVGLRFPRVRDFRFGSLEEDAAVWDAKRSGRDGGLTEALSEYPNHLLFPWIIGTAYVFN